MSSHKARENRVRRALARKGLALARSRARHPEDPTLGLYHIYHPDTNRVVDGCHRNLFSLSLEDLEVRVIWMREGLQGYLSEYSR